MARVFALLLSAIALSFVAADSETSVIVPFADPQPISADILGVDGQGRTTWQLRQGAFTGTWSDPQGSFPGTATLIEGADYASYTYAVSDPEGTLVVGGECSIGAGVAVCVAAESGQDGAATATETDSVTAFGLQIAATAVPTVPPSAGSVGAKNSGSTSGASPPSSTQPSSSVRTSASSIGALAGLLLAYYLLRSRL
ncbi:hypothetical protein C8F04DRAFT_1265002 [Mycena alexandri]|uniref:Uncharacterized protein n=1 Tax=Mycena alexandri TaxID=1745969 RepID=A0AAD6SKJ8_9AGAR|nr:hypothetical protein C8F04DRAFT_1265002 [Mycena alexandri]